METRMLKTRGLARYPVMYGAVLMALGLLIALNVLGLRAAGLREADKIFGLTIPGLAMMAFALVPLIFGLALSTRRAGLQLSPTGFHDPQMTRNEVPWTGLQAVNAGTTNNKRQQAIRLKLTPEAYKAAGVNWLAKLVVADPENGIGYSAKMVEGSLKEFGSEIHRYANEALRNAGHQAG